MAMSRRPSRRDTPRPYRRAPLLDALVMAMLDESNHPLTAYEICHRSVAHRTPLTIAQTYRVLKRLVERGTVQRIELLSAYVATHGVAHGFAVCTRCGAITTFPVSDILPAIASLCRAAGFTPTQPAIEVAGTCADCLPYGAEGRPSDVRRKPSA